MKKWLENIIATWGNRLISRSSPTTGHPSVLDLGARVVDGETGRGRVTIPHGKRAEHLAVLGKTGSGKSSEMKSLQKQDIRAGRGFISFDLHGDTIPFLLGTIAEQEKLAKRDLSDQVIVVAPADRKSSVGINPLGAGDGTSRFVQVAEFAQILRERWHLESLGARTDELLRNALWALAENGLTLLEIAPLLTHGLFRARCLRSVGNAEVKQYFELRYDTLSEPMRRVMAEPILNKISAFTADIHFRHLVGQARSTFSVGESLERARWILLDLPKGALGDQALTFASLFFSMTKHAIFSKTTRNLVTVYADEVQNLVTYGSGLETLLSESRKFSTSIVTANQFLAQYPQEIRAAIMSIGTHLFFQLSSSDAQEIAVALGGGKTLAEILKNLPQRHMIVKSGAERWREAVAPTLREPTVDFSDLYGRSRARWARKRIDIEADIRTRQTVTTERMTEVLNDWE